ncbi:hypothetical protein KAR91_49720 [Candidatus Pacearchaeota archaeon]|nr:hypothetical protein [Candidatus Pacearchaeota archaeon]
METFQSRWGNHPVSHEDFLILKAIHKRYWKSLRQAYIWMRWQRKMDHNRQGPEPKVDKLFIDTSKGWSFYAETKDGGSRCHSCLFRPKFLDIVADFGTARMPTESPDDVNPVDMSKYRELHEKIVGTTVA